MQSIDVLLTPECKLFMARFEAGGDLAMPMVEEAYSIQGKETKWFVVYTNPKCERKVRDGLIGCGFSSYVPVSADWRKQSRREKDQKAKKVRIERPLLTRYVFVEMVADRPPFGKIRLVDGVREILGDRSNPLEVKKKVVDKIKDLEASGVYDDTVKKGRIIAPRGCVPGLKTMIADGPFVSFAATIQEILPNDQVKVEAHVFGTKTFVTLELDQLERVW